MGVNFGSSLNWATGLAAFANAGVPGAATYLEASGTYTTGTTLNWTNPPGDASYLVSDTVYQASFTTGPGCGAYSLIATQTPEATTYGVSGLSSGYKYCWEVYVSNATGTSVASSPGEIETVAPPPTGILQIAPTTTTTFSITWTPPSYGSAGFALDYEILISQNPTTTTAGCTLTGANPMAGLGIVSVIGSTNLPTLAPPTEEFCAGMQSYDTGGLSVLSTVALFATLPAAPTGLTVGTATTSTITLSWTAPTTQPSSGVVTSYNVTRATYSGGSCGAYSTSYTAISGSPYTVTGLGSGSSYCFKINAVTLGGGGASSSSTGDAVTITGAPTALTVGSVTPTTVPLTWTPPSTSPASGVISSYTALQAAYSGSCGAYGTSYTGIGAASYTVTGLSSATAYCFEVEALDSGGTSAPSTPVSAVWTLPVRPTGVTALGTTTVTIRANWVNPPGTLTDNHVYVSVFSGATCGPPRNINVGAVVTAYTITALFPGTGYCVGSPPRAREERDLNRPSP